MRNVVLYLLLVPLVGACARPLEKTEVLGTYEFVLGSVREVVVIGDDGKYTNSLYENGTLVWSDRGEWTYEQQPSDTGVTFTAFRFGIPGHSAQPGLWFVVPSKTLTGGKELCFDLDLGRCFRNTF